MIRFPSLIGALAIKMTILSFLLIACSTPVEEPAVTEEEFQRVNQTVERMLILNIKNRHTQDDLTLLYEFYAGRQVHEDYTRAFSLLLFREPVQLQDDEYDNFHKEHPDATLDAATDIVETYFSEDKTNKFHHFLEGPSINRIVRHLCKTLFPYYWREYPDKRGRIARIADTYFQEYLNTPVDEDLLEDEEYLYRQYVGERHTGVLGRDTMVHFIENLPEEEARAHFSEETFERVEFLKKLYDRLETYVEEEEWKEYIDLDTENGDNEEND